MESLQSNPKLEESEQTPKFEEQPEKISKVEEQVEASISLPCKRDDSVPHESPTPMEEHNSREEASEPISKSEEEAQVPISFPKELDSVPHDESSAAVEEQISIIQEEPEVSVLPPGSALPSELDDSVLRESSAAIEEQNVAELENVDVAMNVDRPGSDLKIESDSFSEEAPTASSSDNPKSPKPEIAVSAMEEDEGEEEEDDPPPKKQKQLASLVKEEEQGQPSEAMVVEETAMVPAVSAVKKSKSKKKNNNVWVTKSTRKGKKKSKTNTPSSVAVEDKVLITPVPRFPDKGDDTPDSEICLSKVYKAEKVEISEDRLTAGSSKGYRMVRATRGAVEGAWYFEIKVVNLGETGHTRLGWSTDKGDLQAPVGYDGNSFGFRDIDGCKIHKALREKYAEEGYKEGDVIGFYINLPDGESFAPKPPHYVFYKGQRYISAPDAKEEPPKVVPGSEISFFKNGVCQGVAFKDLLGGRYYPAASMYTLPDQSNCVVKFNFGPDFDFFPEDFGGRLTPKPMCEVPYHGYNGRLENNGSDDMKS